MPEPTGPAGSRPRAALLVAGAVLALGAVGLIAAAALRQDPASTGPAMATSTPTPPPANPPPAVEVARIHDALHDIDTRCRAADSASSQPQLQRDAEVIVGFARRYPDATFPIDDETGRTLSLLLVARQSLRGCAPDAATRVDAALPAEFRNPTATPS